jgi:hypothetical protein
MTRKTQLSVTPVESSMTDWQAQGGEGVGSVGFVAGQMDAFRVRRGFLGNLSLIHSSDMHQNELFGSAKEVTPS